MSSFLNDNATEMVTIVTVHIIWCIIFVPRVGKSNEKLLIIISIEHILLASMDATVVKLIIIIRRS